MAQIQVHGVWQHQLELLGLLRLHVLDLDLRPEAHAVGGDRGEVDLGQLDEAGPELAQPGGDETLALQGGVVVTVFPEVAVGHGLLERLRDRDAQLVVEGLDLGLQLLDDLIEHGPKLHSRFA